MNRTEFLDTLRSQLSGQMHEGKVAAHVRYYEDYIQSQVRSGRDEQQVLDELGDPRLIARTLLDTDVDNGQLASQCIQKFCSIHSIIQPFLYKTTNHYPVSNRLCAFSILTILALIRNYPSHKIFMKSEAEIVFFNSGRFYPRSKHLLFFTNIHRLF